MSDKDLTTAMKSHHYFQLPIRCCQTLALTHYRERVNDSG